jgi:hypothetical protein
MVALHLSFNQVAFFENFSFSTIIDMVVLHLNFNQVAFFENFSKSILVGFKVEP